jgi:serine/threonine-protein kinase HipA
MSAQHLFDCKQIQRRDMKLAMSVGNNRHYHIHEILPRHYYQTADRAGVPESMVALALGQIGDDLPGAVESACASLPADFPADIRDSIAEGALGRLGAITAAA